MTTRQYSSRSQQTTLTGAVTSGASSIAVVSTSALIGSLTAGSKFSIVIDPDTALEEILDVTAVSTPNLTVTRAIDGSTAQDHSAGAVVRHMIIGRDLRESNLHIEATGSYNDGTAAHDLHGLGSADGTIVGTDKSQTLTLKTLTAPTVNGATLSGTVTSTATITGGTVNPTTLQQGGTSVVLSGATSSITSAMITDGTIVNGDIAATSAIAYSKLNLTGSIVNGDITNDTITNAKINTGAAIDWTKLGISSTVSSTEIGYVDGVTSAIQTQLDARLSKSGGTMSGAIAMGTSKITGLGDPTLAQDAATKAYTDLQVTNLVNGAGAAYDTLKELADLLVSDESTAAALATTVASKAPLASPALTGSPTAPTQTASDNSTKIATTAYADRIVATAPSNLTGPITSVGAATAIASQTGTGTKFVVDTSPTLVTPVLGVATATSVNGTTIPSTKTLVVTTDKLSVHAATTSAELAGVISDETGSGALVFGTSPTVSNLTLTGTLTAAASAGTSGYVLSSTGTGVQWAVAATDANPTVFMLMGA